MTPTARHHNLIVQTSGDELLVYDLDTNKAISLNKTSALIWKYCDGMKSPHDISLQLEKELKANVSEDIVWFALEQLYKENLLSGDGDFSLKYEGMSRREVIKKIGLASAVTLPIVASLVAPQASFAQSACNTGTSCTCTGVRNGTTGNCTSMACNTFSMCNCLATNPAGNSGMCGLGVAP